MLNDHKEQLMAKPSEAIESTTRLIHELLEYNIDILNHPDSTAMEREEANRRIQLLSEQLQTLEG